MLNPYQRLLTQKHWLLNVLACLALLLPSFSTLSAFADPLVAPTIQYISASNLIVIGDTSGVPNGSQTITVPELATTLTTQGFANLLVDQGGGIWLLKAKVFINPTAQLVATHATINELRLESTISNFINITSSRGGYLLIDGIKVIAWDSNANAVDQNTADGRSYLVAQEGGRMDILNSEVAYLGWSANEVSGLVWRKRTNPLDATTGATGIVQNSNIHDNYFGLFAANAYGLKVLNNQIFKNLSYGINGRDDTENLEIGGNNVYSNGADGILLGRQSQNNQVHDNQVHDHTLDGIALEQGAINNVISANTAFNNRNGIALSQASNNQVQGNNLHNNGNGLQVEAKYNPSAPTDLLATANQIVSNTVESNTNYGIYLYSRADRNTLANNKVSKNGINGIYIKSGGNLLRGNTVSNNNAGVVILSEPDQTQPGATPPLDPSGQNNVIITSTITNNTDTGIRLMGGVSNRIGANSNAPSAADGNLIEGNGKDGVAIIPATSGAASTDNLVLYNIIRNNGARGVYVNGATTLRNRISHNSITGNLSLGIKVDGGAQAGIQPPVITSVQADGHVNGTAQPNATLELYFDLSGEGQTFLGTTTADAAGAWTILLPGQDQKRLTALALDASGNTSAFSGSSGSTAGAIYHIILDEHSQKTIEVTGSGAVVSLPDINTGLGISNTNLLVNVGNGVWRLNANLFIKDNVTLNLTAASGVTELQLRSQASVSATVTASQAGATQVASVMDANNMETVTPGQIDYASFVYLRTHGGIINIEGIKVYGWDTTANAFDQDVNNGRAYVIAKYAGALNIKDAELSYLGSADSESYGVAWRDQNDAGAPTVLLTRTSGQVINSQFHHNYYGAYTSQAANMTFTGNQFHDNLRYGLTVRDFSHDLLVDSNLAFNNASHGFLVSRGCYNLVIRSNKAYNNTDATTSLAHGFVLDPGSAGSQPSPDLDNVLESNEAYNNEGYGLRIQAANNNQVRTNNFHDNQVGITVDQTSTGNTLDGNTVTKNATDGIVVRETADGNNLANNLVSENGNNGIYLRSNQNVLTLNQATSNQKEGIALWLPTGVPALQNNQLISNTVSGNLDSGLDLRGATHTLLQGNLVENNTTHGVYLTDGASQNSLVSNILRTNKGYGIKANGLQTVGNTWSSNQISGNLTGGISLSSGANGSLLAPQLTGVVQRTVSGKGTPGMTVEIFTDDANQGNYFEGKTKVGDDGAFTFVLSDLVAWHASKITAVAIDAQGNASAFSAGVAAPIVTVPTPTSTPLPGSTPTPTPLPGSTPNPTGTPVGTSLGHTLYLPVVNK